ncbi:MAG: hypothetical protein Q9221_005613 [Calogaya cf. arnoldii]
MLFLVLCLLLLLSAPGHAQAPAQAPGDAVPGAPAPEPDPTPLRPSTPTYYRYPLDNFHEPWPNVTGFNFTLATDPLPYRARNISRTDVLSLTSQVLQDVRRHLNTKGNTLIPNSLDPAGPVEIAGRLIKFEICSMVAASLTQWLADADSIDTGQLKWGDIVPIVSIFREKMRRDNAWRERAVWIVHRETDVRIGTANIVYKIPGLEFGNVEEPGRCDY